MVRSILAAFLLVLSAGVGAQSSPDLRTQRMQDLLSALQSHTAPETVFAPVFLTAVPPAQLAALVQQLEAQHGKLVAAENLQMQSLIAGRFTLRFERALATATFAVEPAPPGRVTSLFLSSVEPIGDSPERIAADFAALPGRSSFAVIRLDGSGKRSVIHAGSAKTQFAVGSTFKLWVLDALAADVAAGRRRWDEVVRLGPRSLPSGMTQDWPAQAPVTVQTLATLMISMSDNTATDTMMHLVGRERLAQRLRALGHSDPSRMLPMLTTAESFALKLSPPAVQDAYARADDAGQAQLLGALDVAKVLDKADVQRLGSRPTAIDSVEWFASPMDVAAVLDSLRQRRDPRVLEILGVAPTLPADLRERFAYVGYKGGSEVGVIALTWLLRDHAGAWFVVTASWNDSEAALDPRRFVPLAERLVRLAAAQR